MGWGLAAIGLAAGALSGQTAQTTGAARGTPPDRQAVAGPGRQTAPARGAARRGGAPAGRGGAAVAAKAAREQVVRQKVAEVVRARLGLNDDQMAKLGGIDSTYGERRATLDNQDRNVRMKLQQAVADPNPSKAKQDSIELFLTRLTSGIPRARLKADVDEQQALSTVLTPTQRVKFMGIREQVRVLVDSVSGAAPPDTGRGRAGRRGGIPPK